MDNQENPKQDDSQNSKDEKVENLGNFDKYSSYDQAFNKAHAVGGPGKTFVFQDRVYSTDRYDGKDMRQQLDKQSSNGYKKNEDAIIKENSDTHAQDLFSGEGKELITEEDIQNQQWLQIKGQLERNCEKNLQNAEKEKDRLQKLEKQNEKGTS